MRKVIIIGASSGIGAKLALYYAGIGCAVGIAARRGEMLKQIADKYPDRIIYEVTDVTLQGERGGQGETKGAVAGFTTLVERLGGVDLVIYSSGAGEQNTLLNISKELNTVRVNVEGFMMIVMAAFDYFLKHRKRDDGEIPQIVVISSIASVRGLGIATSYSASKRFQVTYMEGLSQLAEKEGLKHVFTTILPGFIDTDFIKGKRYPLTMSLDYAVKCIAKAIEKRSRRKIIDWRWSIVVFFWKLIPEFIWRRIRL